MSTTEEHHDVEPTAEILDGAGGIGVGLTEIRRRRRRFLLLLFVFAPLALVCLEEIIFRTGLPRLIEHVLLLLLAPVIFAGMYRWVSSRCPRCGKQFYAKGLYGNALSSKCLNCGLPWGGSRRDEGARAGGSNTRLSDED